MALGPGNGDHVESFCNSIQVIKNVLSPIESSIRKVAKDFEQKWPGFKVDSTSVKRNSKIIGGSGEKKKRFAVKVPNDVFVGPFWAGKGLKEKKSDGDCFDCSQFLVAWSLLMNKVGKKLVQKMITDEVRKQESNDRAVMVSCDERLGQKQGKILSLEWFMGFLYDHLAQNHEKHDSCGFGKGCRYADLEDPVSPAVNQFDHLKALASVFEGKNEFLGNLKFARVGSVPSSGVGVSSPVTEDRDNEIDSSSPLENGGDNSPQRLGNGLRSTLSTVSLSELVEFLPQLGRPSQDHPDKKKLFSVQDFYRYTEAEGRRFFEELDRDCDGQVTLEDLEVALNDRKLPKQYAHEFMRHTRSHLFSKSFGWKRFLSLMEQKEPTILRAYTSLCLRKSGMLQKSEILASLRNSGAPANEDNAVAMMHFLNADREESISYGHFRNFMALLPSDRSQKDPRSVQSEPKEMPAGNVLKSALAGGISCALSTALMHPIDTVKTRVQASTLTFPQIMSKLPEFGWKGLYKGSTPAILGQFFGHGLRTGIFEASKLLVINIAPTLPNMQVQSTVSFCSAILGTVVRVPSEVLKQRLQAGLFDNAGEALIGTWKQDGLEGFFRGTGATLLREVPFYVAGMGLYAESKKAAQRLLGRELEPWETVVVGAVSGGLTAVLTTPFDVIKTRMMTAPQGQAVSMSMVAFSIVRNEGPLVLFKGAVPRFFWVAPLGAMNFAGYELLRKAMG
ncbi:PREDICTED: mitochondrial substrate carrier family protein C-like isoform X2 [Ipomoea nil]|uniref:mitochondrial substrate carrier family protein C-like isoform X2 n=1 Tax=Ipomoea nil TaxID=35883 RepID=UPI000900DFBA|nr:PREDICTED: mitochondrial substrate carrier family protein C-like isoform X2 [Ipomoea nil]